MKRVRRMILRFNFSFAWLEQTKCSGVTLWTSTEHVRLRALKRNPVFFPQIYQKLLSLTNTKRGTDQRSSDGKRVTIEIPETVGLNVWQVPSFEYEEDK